MISPRRTWQGSVRVSKLLLEHCRRRAVEEGWQLAELARMLICLGATARFRSLADPESSERFKRLATMSKASASLEVAIGRHPRGRRNEPKGIARTTLFPIHLPRGFHDLISTYSATTGRSINSVLSGFLKTGYIIYMQGQNTFLETIRSLQEER
jgi:hypothetical protein